MFKFNNKNTRTRSAVCCEVFIEESFYNKFEKLFIENDLFFDCD